MSDAASAGLDLREQIARIDRSIAETQKFQDEANKLRAEAGKLSRDRFLAPLVVTAAFLGATLAILGPPALRVILGHYP